VLTGRAPGALAGIEIRAESCAFAER
jgi:hypothetical protein